MLQNQERVPNYTCLETITRSRRPPHSLVVSRNGRNRFLRHDIVRLEVAERAADESNFGRNGGEPGRTFGGDPYLAITTGTTGMNSGQSITVPVRFHNPSNSVIQDDSGNLHWSVELARGRTS
jgi:hypothetical protein